MTHFTREDKIIKLKANIMKILKHRSNAIENDVLVKLRAIEF